MDKKKFYLYLWPILSGISFAMVVTIYLRAEGKIPVHFNFRGEPDNWMSPTGFLIFFILLMVITQGNMVLLYRKIDRLWPDFINLPNKKYWIEHPEEGKEIAKIILCLAGSFLCFVLILCQMLIFSAYMNTGFILSTPAVLGIVITLVVGLLFEVYRLSRPA